MSKLSPIAQKIFDHLPENGTKVGGISLQRDLSISKAEYKDAKAELQNAGLVASGRGRGGSLMRVEGKEPEKAPSAQERMAHAREAKVAQSQERKRTTELKEIILAYVREEGYKQVELQHISFMGSDQRPLIEIWNGKKAQMHTIDHLTWSQLQAQKV